MVAKLAAMPEEQLQEVKVNTMKGTEKMRFVPSPGPQTQAYFSKADVLLFGGSPGGGKSALGIGLALNEHFRSLIIRKNFSDLEGIIDNSKKLAGTDSGFVGHPRPKLKKSDGGVIHYAGLAADGGIGGHQGVDHDLIYIDEAAQVPEDQVRLLMAWLRSDRAGQRCRMILGSNPPLDSTGDWMIEYFAPWLDEKYHNPAMPGELRYFLPDDDGRQRECEKEDFIILESGDKKIKVPAQSRTFIPSKFTDNPYYNPEQYAKTLVGLPDAAREILITGNFMLSRRDDIWQCIPTAWVREAQARWKPQAPQGIPMCAIGVDVAQGGFDQTTLAPRHDGWYMPLIVVAGKDAPDGPSVAGLVIANRRDSAKVVIDMGGGYGGSAYDHLKENLGWETLHSYKGAEGSNERTKDGELGFTNVRTAAYWKFREALDPSQPGGSPIMLPPDSELLSDLTTPTYEITPRGIKLETKEDVVKRIRRSPDRGDSVVMAWVSGNKQSNIAGGWQNYGRNQRPQVNLGYSNRKSY